MEGLGSIWKDEPLCGLTRLDCEYILETDFEVLNMALKALYHIMGGRA